MVKFFAFFICLFLLGCAPYEDARREAGQLLPAGKSRPNAPVFCYNSIRNNKTDLQNLADALCLKDNKKAVWQKTTAFTCKLTTPSHAFFKCE